MRIRTIALILLFMLCNYTQAGGVNYRFHHITSENGLPHQQVEALMQDDKGNIWMGTRNGLAVYDGYGIKTYFHHTEDPLSLKHNFIKSLFMDSKKRIWVSTQEGICRYRPATDDFASYPSVRGYIPAFAEMKNGTLVCGGNQLFVYNETDDSFSTIPSLGYSYVISMTTDQKDNLYVATNSSIFRYNSDLTKITQLDTSLYADFLTGVDDIIPMKIDYAGNLWIGRSGKGVMKVNRTNGQTTVYEAKEISDGVVRVFMEDEEHNMWLGTERGITIIHADGEIEILQQDFQQNRRLSDNAIYTIISDSEHNIYIGSYFGGVDVLLNNKNSFSWYEPGYSPKSIYGKVPRAIIEPYPGLFWIATEDNGINIFDSHNGTFSKFEDVPAIGTNVHSLYLDKDTQDIWIGTFRKGLYRFNLNTKQSRSYDLGNGLKSNSVFSIARQRTGKLWIATTQGLFYYDPAKDRFLVVNNQQLNKGFIYTLLVDRSDNVWVGTASNGLYRIDGKNETVKEWRKNRQNGLKDDYITCIYQDIKGTVWIGTNNNGLQYIDLKSDSIHSLGKDNGTLLSLCTVCSIIEDPFNHLWISTSQGLYRYSSKNNAIVRFTTENGLPTNQFNFSSALLAQNGIMLLGTVDGLVTFDPAKLKGKRGPFEVHLKNLIVGNQTMNAATENSPLIDELDRSESIVLTYEQARSFSIEYGVIMPGNISSIDYQVLLEGIDREWRDVGKERKFTGYNLPPGTYRLHIRANNSNEGWEKCPVKELKITVNPPFYRSFWAYMAYTAIIILIAIAIYRLFSVRIREKNAVKIAQMEKSKIEEIDREKFEFFTAVSHELKTPLSLIMAPLKSISRQKMSDASEKNLDLAIKNTKKMEDLINELVTFNKIETNNFPFYIQKGNPLDFLQLAIAPFAELMYEKRIVFEVELENNGEDVWFSPSYVERIVDNLLSNAQKFTPEGGSVAVKARIATFEDPFTYLHIEVSDTGIGIAKEEQENIFRRYYQTKRGYNANSSGWGIGLCLVKRMVELHKGTVSVTSEPGKGSTFTVDLNVSAKAYNDKCLIGEDKTIVPLTEYKFSIPTTEHDSGESLHPGGIYNNSRFSILIVDDNIDLLTFLRDYFSTNYNVLTATNGEEALEIACEKSVELVIADVMMPGMEGTELCRRLKQDMATSHIPVILLTAKSETEDVVLGYESGAEAYVSKPFDPKILELQVNNIIQLYKSRQTEIVNAEGNDIGATSLGELDKDFIMKINSLIDENLANNDLSVADITQKLSISRSLLHTKMKSLVNMSIGDYIRKKRLQKACQLLKDGWNVSETAYRTGFSDPNYFSKTFKKHIGISPTEYINSENRKS